MVLLSKGSRLDLHVSAPEAAAVIAFWRVVAALAAVVGGVCAGVGLAWGVPLAVAWGELLVVVAVLSLCDT